MVPEIFEGTLLRGSDGADSFEWTELKGRSPPKRKIIPIKKEILTTFALVSRRAGMLLTILTDDYRSASCGKYRKDCHQE
jgi:hypothetical protein